MSSPPSREDPWRFRSGWFQRPVQEVEDSGRDRSPVGRASARAGSYLDVARAASGAHHRRNRAGVVVRRGAWVDAFVVPRGRRHRLRGGQTTRLRSSTPVLQSNGDSAGAVRYGRRPPRRARWSPDQPRSCVLTTCGCASPRRQVRIRSPSAPGSGRVRRRRVRVRGWAPCGRRPRAHAGARPRALTGPGTLMRPWEVLKGSVGASSAPAQGFSGARSPDRVRRPGPR